MKFLRGLLASIAGLVLYMAIFTLTMSFVVKNFLEDDILPNATKEMLRSSYLETTENANLDVLNQVLEDEDANKIINDIINEYLLYAEDNNYQVSEDLKNEILDFFDKHLDEMKEMFGEEYTRETLRSDETYNNLTNALNDGFKLVNEELGNTGIEAVSIYDTLTSNKFRLILICLILICIILIGLAKWSWYKWMLDLGVSLLVTGILFLSSAKLIDVIISNMGFDENIVSLIDTSNVSKIARYEVIGGIAFIVIRIILNIIFKPKAKEVVEEKNEEIENEEGTGEESIQ